MKKSKLIILIVSISLLLVGGIITGIFLINKEDPIEYCTVTFNMEGGEEIAPIQVEKGSKLPTLNPVKENNTFICWFLNSTEWTNDMVVTEDITLTAYWEEAVYKVTFDSNGGTEIKPQYIKIGRPIRDAIPTKKGYEFTGWFYNGTKWNVEEGIYQDMELVAGWEEMVHNQTCTVTYIHNDEIIYEDVIPYGTMYEPKALKLKDQYESIYRWKKGDREYLTGGGVKLGVTEDITFVSDGIGYIDDINNYYISHGAAILINYEIDDDVLYLPEVVFLKGQEYYLNGIGLTAFEKNNQFKEVYIPRYITEISAEAFKYCQNVEKITVDENNQKYNSNDNCNAIVETANSKLIYGCKNTIITSSIRSISSYAFCNNLSITEVYIPKQIFNISPLAYEGCANITKVTVDEENKKYDSRDNCNAIISTEDNELVLFFNPSTIPTSVTSIGENAFNSTTLTEIYIPIHITKIDIYAFPAFPGRTVYCEAESRPEGWSALWIPSTETVVWGYTK